MRLSMAGIEAYQAISLKQSGRLEPVPDGPSTTEVPVLFYLDSFVSRFSQDRLSEMTGRLW